MKNFTALTCLGLAPVPAADKGKRDKTSGRSAAATKAPAASALATAIYKMDEAMHALTYTGNPDVDFVTKMIPHHQGAVDMARAELEFGTDPKIRKLAQSIIKSQDKQIAEIRGWLVRYRKAAVPIN
ncbi:CopM family metallochaperone [Hyphomicrobium sp. 2TAF46]|uniref:CopM family metallochaperone n=1 Tax=Hyphomicrobium sp. 2TAF46 TaxID=3233019 RepID=UPI003F91E56F